MRLITLLLAICLTSCCRGPRLNLFSNYITLQDLASVHVRTPDPARRCPTLGQRIFIEWNIPKENFITTMYIKLSIHFGDRTEATESIVLLKEYGSTVYELKNSEFFEKRGIVAYKAELILDDQIISEWRHLLWADKIIFQEEDFESQEQDCQAK